MIFQMHKDHGRHISYSSQEAEANEKNGWKTISEEEFYTLTTLVDQYIEKFGEKPHHRMSEETIKAKLDGHNP